MDTCKTNFSGFIKTAAYTIGSSVMCVPAKMAADAYELYKEIPSEDGVKVAYSMYKEVRPGFDKIAMEMIAANILADLDKDSDLKKKANQEVEPPAESKNSILDPAKEKLQNFLATYQKTNNEIMQNSHPNNIYQQGFTYL